jgi:hypothetical protein
VHQLDISTKILQWVQGLKIFVPVAVAFFVWVVKSSPGCWAARAVNPWTWRKSWVKAKKAKEEAYKFNDVELGVLGTEMANGRLLKLAERVDEVDGRVTDNGKRITFNKEESDKAMLRIMTRLAGLERGRTGDPNLRHRGGMIRARTPSPRKSGGDYPPERPGGPKND